MYDTKVLKIDDKSLSLAKEYILNGELVGFPTETVYGLGAIAYSDEAVKSIFEAKGRPQDNPLIVHVHKDYDADKLVFVDHDYVYKLREAFFARTFDDGLQEQRGNKPRCHLRTRYGRHKNPFKRGCARFFKSGQRSRCRAFRKRIQAHKPRNGNARVRGFER